MRAQYDDRADGSRRDEQLGGQFHRVERGFGRHGGDAGRRQADDCTSGGRNVVGELVGNSIDDQHFHLKYFAGAGTAAASELAAASGDAGARTERSDIELDAGCCEEGGNECVS